MEEQKLQGSGMTSLRTRMRLVKRLKTQGIHHHLVLEAIANTPRHIFVDEALASRAYEDIALPIGLGQTISQPFIVARMTQALFSAANSNSVLEIGTGCGYQTAILAQIFKHVCSIERIEVLQQMARTRLAKLKLTNVNYQVGDGFLGWSKLAPFDAIISTAAPAYIPNALKNQLRIGGKLVIPVGEDSQQLIMLSRTEQGYFSENLEQVHFVPLIPGQYQ